MAPLPSLRALPPTPPTLQKDGRVINDRRPFNSGPSCRAAIDFKLGNRRRSSNLGYQDPSAFVLDDDEDDDHHLGSESCCDRWHRGDFTIVPQNNYCLNMWDILVIVALLTTAFVVPFEVALFVKSPRICDYMSRCIDVIFALDIILSFNVAFPITNPFAKHFYEVAPCKIAQHYMGLPFTDKFTAGWFWPDLVTFFPWEMVHEYLSKGRETTVEIEEDESAMNEIRLVRVLRLVRMFRLVRVVKLVKRWEAQVGVPSAYTEVIKCFMCTIMVVHWFACLWAHLGVFFGGSWLDLRCEREGVDKNDITKFETYNLSLYYCTMLLTTVGLGDVLPGKQQEIAASTVTMLATGMMWSWVTAAIVNAIANSDIFGTHYSNFMDDMNDLMENRGVSTELRRRLRKYMQEGEHVHRQKHQLDCVREITKGLQGELAVESGVGDVCDCVWYLKDITPDVLIDLSQYFTPDIFCPHEFLHEDKTTMVIRRGTCFHEGRVLVRDNVVGEDMILVSDHLLDTWFPRTLAFVEVMKLTRTDLLKVCERHADFSHRIRRAQIKLALWREFIARAKAEKAEATKPKKARLSKSGSKFNFSRSGSNLAQDNSSGQQPGFAFTSKTFLHSSPPANFQATGAVHGSAEFIQQLRALGKRIGDSHAGLRRQLDKLDARISSVERKTARLD